MTPDQPTTTPRQLELLHLLEQHGPSSVRELHDHLPELAYTTVLSMCVRMVEKGLLTRTRATSNDPARSSNAYIYTRGGGTVALPEVASPPQVTAPPAPPATWSTDRARVEQLLAYLGTLRDATGTRCPDAALDTIAALLERAELAEDTLLRRGLRPQPAKPQRGTAVEHRGRVCRVCGRPAPSPPAHRHDDLRVCRTIACRSEARRRDNVAKQRRSQAKKRAAAQAV